VQLITDRRQLLKHGLAVAVTALAGCGGGSDASSPLGAPPAPAPPPTPPTPPAAPTAWSPYVPALIVGSGATFDLTSTLPTSISRGGRFSIDSAGSRLPAGMSLSTAGILAVGSAAIGSVTGVIFTYDTP
jgi:hypothetical protein